MANQVAYDYWREASFTAVSFGDVLGGFTSQLAISDCAERFMGVNTRRYLTESIYMNDIMLALNSPTNNVKTMVEEVDGGLKKGNFQVKEWVLTGQIRLLRYIYHAVNDTFTVRPKINSSHRKRGVRKTKDVKNIEELKSHIIKFGLNKRSLASISMGSFLRSIANYGMAPYVNNLKLIYRDVCRIQTAWDQDVPEKIKSQLVGKDYVHV